MKRLHACAYFLAFAGIGAVVAPSTAAADEAPKKAVAPAKKTKKAAPAPADAASAPDAAAGTGTAASAGSSPAAPDDKAATTTVRSAEAPPSTKEAAPDASATSAAKDAPPANGEKPPEKKARQGLHVAPILGYGFSSTTFGEGPGASDINLAGPSAGLRVGYTVPLAGAGAGNGTYFGGVFVYGLGQSKDLAGGAKVSGHMFYGGGEVGQDIPLTSGGLTIRAYAGIGYASFASTLSASGIDASGSKGSIAVWPGATLTQHFGQFFAGLDARYLFATEHVFTPSLTGGASF
jgi:hypothetical protein